MENASRKYSAQEVRQKIERQKEGSGWEFLFIGANIDAVQTAGRFGIAPERAVNYKADKKGTRVLYDCVSSVVGSFRKNAPVEASWSAAIQEDYESRK